MAKAKPMWGWRAGGWLDDAKFSSTTTRDEITRLAGIDPSEKRRALPLLRGVAAILGEYPILEATLDNAPRPAHMRAALADVRQQAMTLKRRLWNLDDKSKYAVRFRGVDPLGVHRALVGLITAVTGAEGDLRGRGSQHAKRRSALRETVYRLGALYRQHARDDDPIPFVAACLTMARIRHPRHPAKLAALLPKKTIPIE